MSLVIVQIDTLAEQLLLRRVGEDDYSVMVEAGEHGRLTVGRIMLVSRASASVPPALSNDIAVPFHV